MALAAAGCKGNKAAAPTMQALPVKTAVISMQSVAEGSDYVATIKSRRSAMLQPQVSGRLTGILIQSGAHVRSGQVMMEIDAQVQKATVQALKATEIQKKTVYDFNTIESERQRKLYEAGITSRDVYDQATQGFNNAKADYEAAVASRKTQEEQLTYYTIRAPFDGIVGDIPVHVGDYVSSSTQLTTVDDTGGLEAYIYLPTERGVDARTGLEVNLFDTGGQLLEKTKINFLSPQVDPTLQGILAKAPVNSTRDKLRNAQLVKARVIWGSKPMPIVPVLAVVRQGGQSFVFVVQKANGMAIAHQVPVVLGDTVGNSYAVSSGLSQGDQVIVTGTQFLVNNMPVVPMGS